MRFLGPVFWYDLVHVARRQPLALWRGAYGLGLLIALFILYATALPNAWFGGHVSDKEAANFARSFFDVFTFVQFAVVILITPALAANAVAEERSNNTLVFLLTTHLTNREIILGKLLTRLLQVGLLILTGLPVLAILQLLGGVEANLIYATYAALAVTTVTLGCLGLFCGVFVRKPQNAAWRAYQILIGYLALSMLSIWYFELPDGPRQRANIAAWQTVWSGPGVVTGIRGSFVEPPQPIWAQTLDWFDAPNPYFARLLLADLQAPGSNYSGGWARWLPVQGKSLNESLFIVLRDYVLAHAFLSLVLGGLAIVRLRAVSAKQSPGITHKKKLILRPAPHPPIRERPVLWKELYCEAKPRQRWLRLFFGRWFFFASFLPIWFYMVLSLDNLGFSNLTTNTLFLLRYVGTFVVGLLCLRIAMHAARSIGGERDRQTLDSLLTTQLKPDEIIRDKWWGSLLSGRWMFLWLLINWCLGMLPFALHPLALPVLALETVIYAAFAASLGIFFAVYCRTTKGALTATLLVGLIGTTFMPWALGKCATFAIDAPQPPQHSPWRNRNANPELKYSWDSWPNLIGQGLVPPWVLANTVVPLEVYPFGSWRRMRDDHYLANLALPAMFGMICYAALSWALLRIAQRRFGKSTAGHAIRRHADWPKQPAVVLTAEPQS